MSGDTELHSVCSNDCSGWSDRSVERRRPAWRPAVSLPSSAHRYAVCRGVGPSAIALARAPPRRRRTRGRRQHADAQACNMAVAAGSAAIMCNMYRSPAGGAIHQRSISFRGDPGTQVRIQAAAAHPPAATNQDRRLAPVGKSYAAKRDSNSWPGGFPRQQRLRRRAARRRCADCGFLDG